MLKRRFGGLFLAAGLFLAMAFAKAAQPTPVVRSQEFFQMLDRGQERQATLMFQYPETDSDQQHSADVQGLLAFLTNLRATTGSLSVRVAKKLDEWALTIGAGGGNIPYWASHHEYDIATTVDYVVNTQRVGIVGFTFNWISVQGVWKLKSVMIAVPAARPDATAVVQNLARPFLSKKSQDGVQGG